MIDLIKLICVKIINSLFVERFNKLLAVEFG